MKSNNLNKVVSGQPSYPVLRIVKIHRLLFHHLQFPVMPSTVHTDTNPVHQQNISYYDKIAGQYDEAMAKETSNQWVRQQVKEQLLQALPGGTVLDFGGGTGLDLGWLTEQQYHIIFCEPSAGMREEAIRYNREILHNNHIRFLEQEQTDFATWPQQLPFPQPADAIIANFGVLNAIPDLQLLFHSLSLAVRPGGHLLIVVLERPFKKMWKWHRRNALTTLLSGKPFVMYVRHKEYLQTVYVHTPGALREAAAPYFEYAACKPVNGTSFILLHLVRK